MSRADGDREFRWCLCEGEDEGECLVYVRANLWHVRHASMDFTRAVPKVEYCRLYSPEYYQLSVNGSSWDKRRK